MSRAIVIETSSRAGQVALADEGQIVRAVELPPGRNQAALVVAEIDRLCRKTDWAPAKVPAVYVSVGPGAFTGTRIAVTYAKTFAFATGAKVVAVPTPAVIVANLPTEATDAAVVVDARRGMTWAEQFRHDDGRWRSLKTFGLMAPADLVAALPRPVWLIGEGVAYHHEALGSAGVHLLAPTDARPRVEVVAELGFAMAQRGETVDAASLVPRYVRRPEAEEKRLGAGPSGSIAS